MNEALADQNDSDMFVTLFVGALDMKTGHLEYCNAGHDAPLLVYTKEKRVELLPCEPNLPLGVMPGWEFKMQETDLALDTLIFLYTDGLTEAEDVSHQLFGDSRISETVLQLLDEDVIRPQSLIEYMTETVHKFVGDAEQSDDLTMLAIKRK